MSGVERIAAERQRQIEGEGRSLRHDDDHVNGELGWAAQCYIVETYRPGDGDAFWPWDAEWWKPSDDPIRNLEKAGALIAAEIDRIERSVSPQEVP